MGATRASFLSAVSLSKTLIMVSEEMEYSAACENDAARRKENSEKEKTVVQKKSDLLFIPCSLPPSIE
jgi:hypothetical protein